MKKISKLISIILIFIIGISLVSAYECEYSDLGLTVYYDESGNPTLSQTKYDISEPIPVLKWFVNYTSGDIEPTNKLTKLEPELIGMCPQSIYACSYEYSSHFSSHAIWVELYEDNAWIYNNKKSVYLFYSENEMKEDSELGSLPNNEEVTGHEFIDDVTLGYRWATSGGSNFWTVTGGILSSIGTTVYGLVKPAFSSSDTIYTKYKSCNLVSYTGARMPFNLACSDLNVYLSRYNKVIDTFNGCDDTDAGCKSDAIQDLNKQEEIIKGYCNTILSEYDYGVGNEQDCIDSCLDIKDKLIKAKKAAGIIPSSNGECGFSQNLIYWIANIIRWMKYLIPVVVIVLGIIDFIRAVAADKDDEMKKAQGRFVKRLIAAALIFIVPFIIEFVLDKFGFDNYISGCGIIDL